MTKIKTKQKNHPLNTQIMNQKPAADNIIFGRLCSTILPWYVLHINFKVFVCLGLLLPFLLSLECYKLDNGLALDQPF